MKRGEGDFALKTACAKLGVVRRRVDQALIYVTFSPLPNYIISSITTGLPHFFIAIPHPPTSLFMI